MVVKGLGNKASPAPYLRVVGVMLESAVINVPIVALIAVGLWINKVFVLAIVPVVGASQVCRFVPTTST